MLLLSCKGPSPGEAPPPAASSAVPAASSAPEPTAAASPRYHVREVKDGHHVTVKLAFTGKPRPTTFTLPAPYEAHCGTLQAPNEALVVAPNGGVDGAVMWLEGITEGEAPPDNPTSQDEKSCGFSPHVLTVGVKQPIHLVNSDPGNHMVKVDFLGDPHLDDVTRVIASGSGVILTSKPEWAGRIGRLTCPIHLWMSGWLLAFDHPYFAVTAAGAATLARVPPGHYDLVVWHEGLDATFDGKELHASDPQSIRVPIDVGTKDVTRAFTLADDGSIHPAN